MKNDVIINKLRLDDEILSAVLSGKGYKPLKLSNRTLSRLRDTYETLLDDCDCCLNDYHYNGGKIIVDIDNTIVYQLNGVELAVSATEAFDRETLGDLLLAVLSTYMRLTYRDVIDLLDSTIAENTAKVTLDGVSSMADGIREDIRFAANAIDGVDMDGDDEIPTLYEDDTETEEEDE